MTHDDLVSVTIGRFVPQPLAPVEAGSFHASSERDRPVNVGYLAFGAFVLATTAFDLL